LSHVHQTINANSELQQLAPFSNTNYRAAVRIVNYWPHDLKDFSVGRRKTEYDILSDNSDGNESSDVEENMRQFHEGKGFGRKKIWEWRFALQVEDLKKDPQKETTRMWLMVDNASAQMLLGLDANKYDSTLLKLYGPLILA
jgi:protection-of-telomeres protein 1